MEIYNLLSLNNLVLWFYLFELISVSQWKKNLKITILGDLFNI